MKATPETAKQYLRDQINDNSPDPLNIILKNYENLAKENLSNKHDSLRMNNKNDTQRSSMQGHIENRIPASCEQKEIPSHKNKNQLDERIFTQAHYRRISKNQTD